MRLSLIAVYPIIRVPGIRSTPEVDGYSSPAGNIGTKSAPDRCPCRLAVDLPGTPVYALRHELRGGSQVPVGRSRPARATARGARRRQTAGDCPGGHLSQPPLARLRPHQRSAAASAHRGTRIGSPTKDRGGAGPPRPARRSRSASPPGTTHSRSLLRLFENLGFRPVATIRKTRTPFHLTVERHDIEVALDQAEGLGDFAEIETLAATESDLPAAQAAVLAVADQLGLTEVEPRSYLRMALDARRQATSRPARGESAASPRTPIPPEKVLPKPASQTRRIVVRTARSQGRDVAVTSSRTRSRPRSIARRLVGRFVSVWSTRSFVSSGEPRRSARWTAAGLFLRPKDWKAARFKLNINTLFGLQVSTNLNVPITYQQKSLRIQRLPYYLDKIAPTAGFCPSRRDQANPELPLQHGGRDPPATSPRAQQLQLSTPTRGSQAVVEHGRHPPPQLLLRRGLALRQDPHGLDRRHANGLVQAHLAGRHRQRPAGHPGDQRLHPRAADRAGHRPPDAAPSTAQNQKEPRDPGECPPHQDSAPPADSRGDLPLPHRDPGRHARGRRRGDGPT